MTARPPIRVGFAGWRPPPALIAAFQLSPDILPLTEPLNLEQLEADAHRQQPDVILVEMGEFADGALSAIGAVMSTCPLPILALFQPDAVGQPDAQALRAGAVETMPVPANWTAVNTAQVCERVRVLRGVAVLRRRQGRHSSRQPGRGRLVAIGASTGGPAALVAVLAGLEGIQSPVLIVQHQRPDFHTDFFDWLARNSALPVQLAQQREVPVDGVAYLAPRRPPENRQRPKNGS